MTEFQNKLVAQFLGEHWTAFLDHLDDHGLNEGDAEDIVAALEGSGDE